MQVASAKAPSMALASCSLEHGQDTGRLTFVAKRPGGKTK